MATDFSEGQVVDHKAWGRGKVVMVDPPYMTIQFPSLGSDPDAARRKLQLASGFVTLSSDQQDPAVAAIETGPVVRKRPGRGGAPVARRKAVTTTLPGAIEWFTTTHPGRFDDPALVSAEIRSKRDAQALFAATFGDGKGRALLAAGDPGPVTEGLAALYAATNIPSVFEVRAMKLGLADGAAAARVLDSLLTFSDTPDAETFAAYASAFGAMSPAGANSRVLTWPNLTLAPFLARPDRFAVLKPEAAQKIAGRMERDLLYSTTPAWAVYEGYLTLASDLLELLRPLGAKDLLDVHAFIWVTRGLE